MKGKAALRALEVGLLVIGIAALTTYGLLELEKVRGQADLREQFESRRTEQLPAELPGDPAQGEEPAGRAPRGTVLGRLTAERIGLDVMIAEGVDRSTLRRAAGRIPGTARLDSEGNVGIAAHRDTFFRPLKDIQQGDVLDVETQRGAYRYRVKWLAVVDPNDVQLLKPSSDAELTLVTCYPFYYVGPAPRRFIVRALRIDERPAQVATSLQAESEL